MVREKNENCFVQRRVAGGGERVLLSRRFFSFLFNNTLVLLFLEEIYGLTRRFAPRNDVSCCHVAGNEGLD